jgi:predicted ATP-dependent Lon-type protease
MKSKLAKEKEDVVKTAISIEDILKEKYEATKEKEEASDLKKNKGRVRDVVRVSVDFPRGLYTKVVDETDRQEQTIRDFILTLVRQHFSE